MRTDNFPRPPGHRCNLVHIQGRCVGGEDCARRTHRIELGKDPLLGVHFLVDRLDHDIWITQSIEIRDAFDQRHTAIHLALGDAALGNAGGVIAADYLQAILQRRILDLENIDWNTGIGEIHGDATAHGAAADHRRAVDLLGWCIAG